MTFAEALRARVLLGDGANGTWLASRGLEGPYDLATLYAPDAVREAHAAYFAAGADFVETNTYTAHRLRLPEGSDVRALNLASARLAREAAPEGRYVVGAVGPAGRVLAPVGTLPAERYAEAVREQTEALVEGGVDAILLETFVDLDELLLAIEAVRQVTDLPILASKAFAEDGETLAEGLPGRIAARLAEAGIEALGANCVVGPQRMLDVVRGMAEATGLPVLAFPTPGLPQLVKGQLCYDTSPDYFARAAARLAQEGARIVGGCCGTTPAHIAALRAQLDRGLERRARSAPGRVAAAPKAPPPESPSSRLAQKLAAGEFVQSVEMDVPRGMDLGRMTDGVRRLQAIGVEFVNVSDGARARLRVMAAAVAAHLQRETGIEATLHFACRDRNLLAVQSDLLGARHLGIQNVLAVTGDPANIGDYPSATSVFDIDAIGLCRILSRFNEGVDLAGNPVGLRCGFTVACAYNPLAADQEGEDDRLRRKADAGAHVVFTQPVFSPEVADRAVEAGRRVGLPVLIGLLPLRHSRHAEFMHHEVPGVSIPESLRQHLASAESDADALEVGVEAARTLTAHIRECAAGLYLMPPVNGHVIAERVLAASSRDEAGFKVGSAAIGA